LWWLLVGGIQLLLILLLLLLQLLHLLHELLRSLGAVLLLAVIRFRAWVNLRPSWHYGTAESIGRRNGLGVRILVVRSVGNRAPVVAGILVLRRLRVLVLCRIHGGASQPRSQNNFLYPAWISGYTQDDVVELRPVQQRVQHVARKSGPELRHYPFITGTGRNVNGRACPRLYGAQNLCQRGIRSINRQLAILEIDSRRGRW